MWLHPGQSALLLYLSAQNGHALRFETARPEHRFKTKPVFPSQKEHLNCAACHAAAAQPAGTHPGIIHNQKIALAQIPFNIAEMFMLNSPARRSNNKQTAGIALL